MKKALICISSFVVLFLVMGVNMTQADVTGGMNGTWLKFTASLKGMEFADGSESTIAGVNDNESIKLYGCLVDGDFYDKKFFIQVYEKAKTAVPSGAAVFQKSAGTEDKFAGWFSMNLMEDYNPATPALYTTSVSVPGEMTIKRGRTDQISFKGFGGQAEKNPTVPLGDYTGYALYGVKKFNAKTAKATSLPFDEDTACPSGYVIQVKKTDDGVHTGTVSPAGPWVSVAANADQAFTITTTEDNTAVYVYVDGNIITPVYENTSTGAAGFTYTYTFSVVGANHSIWVDFD